LAVGRPTGARPGRGTRPPNVMASSFSAAAPGARTLADHVTMLGDRSAAPIQRVRGTTDVLPPKDARLRRLESTLRDGFASFGYQGIETPILEPLELFLRKSGDEIIARMYSFSHWNRRLCLRPELTASVMRAFVDELQGRSLPLRLHYGGPMFRYERPSRGRSRQFTGVGIALVGVASETAAGRPPTLADLPPEQATAIAADILSRASLPVEGGARQPGRIIQRLLAKARRPDPTDQVRAAFEFVAELHAAAAPPDR